MSKKTVKLRAFARGAGSVVTVFPRATVTMTMTSAAGPFLEAKRSIASASRHAEKLAGWRGELAQAE